MCIRDRRDHRGIHLGLDQRQLKELRFLHGVDNVNWIAVSPSNTFAPGESTGFVLGRDDMLVAPDGSSHLTPGTMAVAILNTRSKIPATFVSASRCAMSSLLQLACPGPCLLYTSPSPRDRQKSRMPSSA